MTPDTKIIRDEDAARRLGEYILACPLPIKVTITNDMVRTLSQNALIHKNFGEIADQTVESADEIKRQCKLYQGCPILMAEDPKFADFVTKIAHLTVEQKIAAMDFVSVTSVMSTKQLGQFIDAVHRKYASQGVRLTLPEPKK